jgi:CheY-like chemotaxis protein
MLRVLVVEDWADTATSLARLLHCWGYDARIARDGATALKTADSFQPQAVLLDINLLKGMDGYEVARRLRQQEGPGKPTIICISGYATQDHRRRAREAGCDHYLIKPAEPEAIRLLLEACPR